jgi:hypothetical protein
MGAEDSIHIPIARCVYLRPCWSVRMTRIIKVLRRFDAIMSHSILLSKLNGIKERLPKNIGELKLGILTHALDIYFGISHVSVSENDAHIKTPPTITDSYKQVLPTLNQATGAYFTGALEDRVHKKSDASITFTDAQNNKLHSHAIGSIDDLIWTLQTGWSCSDETPAVSTFDDYLLKWYNSPLFRSLVYGEVQQMKDVFYQYIELPKIDIDTKTTIGDIYTKWLARRLTPKNALAKLLEEMQLNHPPPSSDRNFIQHYQVEMIRIEEERRQRWRSYD